MLLCATKGYRGATEVWEVCGDGDFRSDGPGTEKQENNCTNQFEEGISCYCICHFQIHQPLSSFSLKTSNFGSLLVPG